MKEEELELLFPLELRFLLGELKKEAGNLEEIRIRVNQPVFLRLGIGEKLLDKRGKICNSTNQPFIMSEKEMEKLLDYLFQYSLYSYEAELQQGFFTIRGGHRIGVAGKVILEKGKIKNIKYISSVNIRIAHEIREAAAGILPYLFWRGQLYNSMIISPPGIGKSTLLRDLVRRISEGSRYGRGVNVGLIDERMEIGGSYQGIPQNDVGMRTDILSGCGKSEGMMMLIRSMAPGVIAADEIGSREDCLAIEEAVRCGCRMVVTVHSGSMEELFSKRYVAKLLQEGLFQRFLLLSLEEQQDVEGRAQSGRRIQIFDQNRKQLGSVSG